MDLSFLSRTKLFISENFKELLQFLKSTSFSKGILVGFAVTIPVLVGLQLGFVEIGMAMSFGALWSSTSDVIGSFRYKKISILIAAALVMVMSFIKGYLHFDLWLMLPVLGLLTFAIAFIAVYGFRASLISFSGLMALALSFPDKAESLEIYQYAIFLGVGGLWYLLVAKVWHSINPKAMSEELFSDTYLLMSEFLHTRGKMVDLHSDYEIFQSKLLQLQSELTEKHQKIREILLSSSRASGWSHYQDKHMLIFVELVDMLETAIANPANYDRIDALFSQHPQYIRIFQDLIFEMSQQLRTISEVYGDKKKLPTNDKLTSYVAVAKLEINKLLDSQEFEEFILLQNWLEYQEKQFEKIKRIKWLLGDVDADEIKSIDKKTFKRFLPSQDYDPVLLLKNLSFKSTIFRHSFRLAITVMIGYALGSIFAFQNPYSVMFIVMVIMRPSYGLTKNRAKDRIIGTLLGAAIGSSLLFLIQNPYVYGVLGVSSLVIALSMVQKNYKAAATFITLSVVFIYAIIIPDVLTLIKFRIFDTVVGAGLAFVAMRLLWPSWAFVEIKDSIEKSVRANKDFLHKINEYYQKKGNIPTSYNIARKEAFLGTSNLSAAFQRMALEPKSKQKRADEIYKLVILNHRFLASLASLSTYNQYHSSSDSSGHFKEVTEKIEANLDLVIECLEDSKCIKPHSSEPEPVFDLSYPFSNEAGIDLGIEDLEGENKLQETLLVWEQLQGLLIQSNEMLKLAASIKPV